MKKLIYLFIILIAGFTACKKEAEITKMAVASFSSEPTASASSLTLTKAKDTSSVVTFSWPAVKYPVKAQVTYALQIDVPTDTVGNNAWANAKTVVVGK